VKREEAIDAIIASNPFRRNVYDLIPEGARRILDFGCGKGALLLRLMRDKNCRECYGVEVNRNAAMTAAQFVNGVWVDDIEKNDAAFREYDGFFNYVILHDVVEHLYDPWFTLTKIRNLLADDGRIIIATPNFHNWALQHTIMSGHFPYGPGLWHTGHLRWYTPISLIELLLIGGMAFSKLYLEIPRKIDFSRLATEGEVTSIDLPPIEWPDKREKMEVLTMSFARDIRKYYPVFHAHKIIADCKKGELLFEPAPTTYNCMLLEQRRRSLDLQFDVYEPPNMHLLMGPVS
jgi:SAM-dependent methyltransferase